ncbi:MAG: DUF6599 family protein [Acidobacteriota bacterium]
MIRSAPAFVVLLACAALMAQAPDCGLVPGWTQHGPARTFVADNLYEYMNGNAEGYLIYRFVRMQGVSCRSGGDTIIFDVSEMTDPESAYGMFTANRDPNRPPEKIGMGGQVLPRKATFAKDKYYVEFSADTEKDHSAALRAFAVAMEKRISGRTALPETLGWFPAGKLVADSIRLVPESVLGLRLLKRGYVAQYEFGKAFIVAEASPEEAAGVMRKLRARFGQTEPAKVADEAFQANDRYLGRLCFFRKGRYLGGFAGLKDDQDPAALSAELAARIP